ncbi:MAG: MurR/RpiR family transcriptional regulator [Ruminococcus sp.]|nr:MurR/RpiR family transcriptional regulator [Ruminococcus sp.]MCD7800299.1 MurR/RpiR family transcriptional regulator [Ruminococcus sp.]
MNGYGDCPLFIKIKNMYPSMSKGHRKIADYILENYDKAGFMTALKLGETAGVSESTAVRFAYELGFEGYPEFQKELSETAKRKLTFIQRMDLAEDKIKDGDILQRVTNLDIASIRSTMENVSKDEFYSIVDTITSAKKVYIIGSRSAEPLAVFLHYYLNLMLNEVINVKSSGTTEVLQQVLKIDSNDVIIGISFPRYSSQTLNALQYSSDRNANVIAITDSLTSPIAKVSKYTLLAKNNMNSFVDSLAGPLSLLNALLVSISIIKKDELSQTFATLEKIWDEYGVYDKSEEV